MWTPKSPGPSATTPPRQKPLPPATVPTPPPARVTWPQALPTTFSKHARSPFPLRPPTYPIRRYRGALQKPSRSGTTGSSSTEDKNVMSLPSAIFRHRPSRQSGIATLFIVLMLLLAAGLIMLYTSRGAVMEQRLSANEIRAKQATAAANAGLDRALTLANDATGGVGLVKFFDANNHYVAPTAGRAPTSPFGTGASTYLVKYCNITTNADTLACGTTRGNSTACTAPNFTNLVDAMMFSCGWSDDDSAVHKMTQKLRIHPGLACSVSTPLITRGTANLLVGGASVLNYFNDLTVGSGGSLLGQSMTGKTFTRNIATDPAPTSTNYRNTGNSPACNNPPTGYSCSTQGSTLGHDAVFGDTNLSSLSANGFFNLFFGSTPADYRNESASWVVDHSGSLAAPDSTNISSITSKNGNIIWIEPSAGTPASLPGNVGTQN